MVMYPQIQLDFSHAIGDEKTLLTDTLLLLSDALGIGAAGPLHDLISAKGRGWASTYGQVAKLIQLVPGEVARLTEKMTPVRRDAFARAASHFFQVAGSLEDLSDHDDYLCWCHELQIAKFSWQALSTPREQGFLDRIFNAWLFELSDGPGEGGLC